MIKFSSYDLVAEALSHLPPGVVHIVTKYNDEEWIRLQKYHRITRYFHFCLSCFDTSKANFEACIEGTAKRLKFGKAIDLDQEELTKLMHAGKIRYIDFLFFHLACEQANDYKNLLNVILKMKEIYRGIMLEKYLRYCEKMCVHQATAIRTIVDNKKILEWIKADSNITIQCECETKSSHHYEDQKDPFIDKHYYDRHWLDYQSTTHLLDATEQRSRRRKDLLN